MKINKLILFILFVIVCLNSSYASDKDMLPPGVVIHNSPAIDHKYVGSPSIVIMPDGTYIASHDYFGKQISDTFIYMSQDKGNTWTLISTIQSLNWATLFNIENELYLIGIRPAGTMGYGDFVVHKSLDQGFTWTIPIDSTTGLIKRGFYHCAPVPVVCHNNRYWRALENMGQKWGWGPFSALMTSIPCGLDLLDSSNWTFSNELKYDSSWKSNSTAWLEGNAILSPNGEIKDVLRVAYIPDDVAAVVSVSSDGKKLSFNPEVDYVHFPGGGKKFTIRYDEKSHKYLSITNYVLSKDRSKTNNGAIRNTLVLISSDNLIDWSINDTILTCENPSLFGFQYVDWVFDNEDIVFVSRTAWRDSTGLPPRQHDANYLTFHRMVDFRKNLNQKQ